MVHGHFCTELSHCDRDSVVPKAKNIYHRALCRESSLAPWMMETALGLGAPTTWGLSSGAPASHLGLLNKDLASQSLSFFISRGGLQEGGRLPHQPPRVQVTQDSPPTTGDVPAITFMSVRVGCPQRHPTMKSFQHQRPLYSDKKNKIVAPTSPQMWQAPCGCHCPVGQPQPSDDAEQTFVIFLVCFCFFKQDSKMMSILPSRCFPFCVPQWAGRAKGPARPSFGHGPGWCLPGGGWRKGGDVSTSRARAVPVAGPFSSGVTQGGLVHAQILSSHFLWQLLGSPRAALSELAPQSRWRMTMSPAFSSLCCCFTNVARMSPSPLAFWRHPLLRYPNATDPAPSPMRLGESRPRPRFQQPPRGKAQGRGSVLL